MRTESLFVLALALLASAAPAPEAEANAAAAAYADAHGGSLLSRRGGSAFGKRSCIQNGCKCNPGTAAGVYCSACSLVTAPGETNVFSGDANGWGYQCAENGDCCALGPHDSCAGGKGSSCGAVGNTVAATDANSKKDASNNSKKDANNGNHVSKRGSAFEKRECIQNGCKCSPGAAAGQYCHASARVTAPGTTDVYSGDAKGWSYQCAENGDCCALGPHDSCAGGKDGLCDSKADAVTATDADAHSHDNSHDNSHGNSHDNSHDNGQDNSHGSKGNSENNNHVSKRGSAFEKRECIQNGCKCSSGTPAGPYCHASARVTAPGMTDVYSGDAKGWAFKCAKNGDCCALGPEDSCAGGKDGLYTVTATDADAHDANHNSGKDSNNGSHDNSHNSHDNSHTSNNGANNGNHV